jgi:hypothetical protein
MHSAHMVKKFMPRPSTTVNIFQSFMRCDATCVSALYALFIMYVLYTSTVLI